MYISAINPININRSQILERTKTSNNVFLSKPYACDEVSFGHGLSKFDKILYRAIGKSELDELLKPNGYIYGQKYTTGNPMGWGAKNWASGFKYGQDEQYFVEFKPEKFDITQVYDASDYTADSRFVVSRGYSLDDVRSIREGTNSHGKIVWADSIETKTEDLAQKTTSIFNLLKTLLNSKNQDVLDDAIMELSSYAKEFPQVAKPLIMCASSDKDLAYRLSFLIAKTEDKSYLDFMRGYYKDFLNEPNKVKIHEMSLHYMAKFGSNEDFDLLFDVMQKDNDIMYHSYGIPLGKLMEEKDIPKMLELLKTSNSAVQNAIVNGFICHNDKKLATDVIRSVLNQYSTITPSVAKQDGELKSLFATCVDYLFKTGEKSDIPLLRKFTNLGIYTDVDFKALIKELSGE